MGYYNSIKSVNFRCAGIVAVCASLSVLLPAMNSYADIGDQLFKFVADDGEEHDAFGQAVDVSGSTAIIGAVKTGDDEGSAYLFDTNTGLQTFELGPDLSDPSDFFGFSVAISGTTAIVGSLDDNNNNNRQTGSAFLFNTQTGELITKLLAKDGFDGDRFGYAVGISGTTSIVGSPYDADNGPLSGSAYLFTNTTGRQITKLVAIDGAEGDYFGYSVDISGDKAIVSSVWDDDNGSQSGSAYLFNANTGELIVKLLAIDGASHDAFGYSVAISGNTAIVGALGDDENGSLSGSAYLFNATTGEQLAKIVPDDGAVEDLFGLSVSIYANTAVISSIYDDDNGTDSGSVYLFDITDRSNPIQIAKILPEDGATEDKFGCSVAINGSNLLVGAYWDSDNGRNSGSAYLFDSTPSNSTTATLTNLVINTGTIINGDINSLINSDDQSLNVQSGFGQSIFDLHSVALTVNAEAPGIDPASIDVVIESRLDEPAGLVQVKLKNFTTNNYDLVSYYTVGNSDGIESIKGLNANYYYNSSNGTIELKIKYMIFVPFLEFTFESFIDQLEITVQ